MQFELSILNDLTNYKMKATRVSVEGDFETFLIEPLNGTGQNITVRGNRLLFKRKGLKNRSPNWVVKSGKVTNRSAFDKLVIALNKKLKEVD